MSRSAWALCAFSVMLLVAADLTGALTAPTLAEPAARVVAPATGGCPDGEERDFLSLINAYRAKKGRKPLVLSATLGAAAEHHSQDMATLRKITGHTLSDGTGPLQNIRNHGYAGSTWGENILWGTDASAASVAFDRWKHSPEHRKNMVNGDFTAIGIARAYVPNSPFGWYWTTTFGGTPDGAPSC